jgi:MFS family permease
MSSRAAAGSLAGTVVRFNRRQMLLAYVSGSFGFGFGTMVSFLVPLRAGELGASPEVIGLIVGAGALLSVPLSMPIGVLIDRLGPRRSYILGTALSGIGTLWLALATDAWTMLVAQLLFGIPRGIPWVASQAYITGIGTAEDQPRITGRFSFFVNGGLFVAPLLVGWVAEAVGYQRSFYFLALVALLFTLIGVALPELPQHAPAAGKRVGSLAGFGDAYWALRLPRIQIMILFSLARVWLWTMWPAFFPLFLTQHGYSPGTVGLILAARGLLATFAPLSSGRAAQRIGLENAAAASVLVMAAGLTLSPLVTAMPFVFLPAMLIGLADGFNLPLLLAITAAASPQGRRGIAMAMRVGANQGASIIAPVAGGWLVAALGVTLGFAASAVISGLMVAAGLWRYRSRVLHTTGPDGSAG